MFRVRYTFWRGSNALSALLDNVTTKNPCLSTAKIKRYQNIRHQSNKEKVMKMFHKEASWNLDLIYSNLTMLFLVPTCRNKETNIPFWRVALTRIHSFLSGLVWKKIFIIAFLVTLSEILIILKGDFNLPGK